MPPILSAQNISFTYPDYPQMPSAELFSDLNLTLETEQITLLLGRPESGKTTLVYILAGLVPRFTGGKMNGLVEVQGRSVSGKQPYDLIEELGIVFQNPDEQLFTNSCAAEIAFPLESLGLSRQEIDVRVERALNTMDIRQYRERSPNTLSGGEKKKLLLACLIAVDPTVWILDETLEELDEQTKVLILEYLKSRKKTVLILSAKWHKLFAEYIQAVLILQDGVIRKRTHSEENTPADWNRLERKTEQMPAAGIGRIPSRKLLQTTDIHFHYDTLDPFSLDIPAFELAAGEVLALTGGNGSGKTTLAKLLCGLLKPLSGSIRLFDETVPADSATLNAHVGYMFQSPDLQIFAASVQEELAYGLKLEGLPRARIETRIQEAVSLFHLPSSKVPPSLMSYGARKRLQAAVYYLLQRPLLILDEGDSGLGTDEFARIVKLLSSQEKGLVLITHDMELAAHLSNRLISMELGKIV